MPLLHGTVRKPGEEAMSLPLVGRWPIILCCGASGQCVLVGEVEQLPEQGQAVTMYYCRQILRWSEECVGLLGLAANGPRGDTLITPSVEVLMETKWQEWLAVSPTAWKAIQRWR